MSTICTKAELTDAQAFYVLGQLIIRAKGTKPTPCHQVRVEHWPYRIYPPQYQVVACVDPGVICMQQIMPYTQVGVFSVSEETLEAMDGIAIVHHRDGDEKVPVTVIKLSKEKVALSAEGEREGGLPYPFSVAKLLETGRAEDLEIFSGGGVSLHTATGYSDSFSFTEAFQNAIANLPPDQNSYPDKLIKVTVVKTGGEFGGLPGLNRMFVTVASLY
jgi:hypothetical protein